ncbi:DUF1320 domain-containing protein [Shewanella sp. WXL01]|uniref:gp436 family protein n=1 Tax=Shewanella sp. WXL01 TaxID=2709721 RepID=UPI0014384A0D|nr:phage protein Gp36 family protein [Shewanella sp. WXL01]NKF51366.1 DUF1320 domain-containing protein [Shewanella sp. WXL01]
MASVYATTQDMVARFGEQELIDLTDRDGSQGSIVSDVLDTALASASALIDGYLAGRYQLPMTNALPVLADLCCEIARYKLYDEEAHEAVQQRFKDAERFLVKVSKGEISLGVDTAGESATSTDLPQIESAGSVFARDSAKGFI